MTSECRNNFRHSLVTDPLRSVLFRYSSDTHLSRRCITLCTFPTLSCHTGALLIVHFRHSVVIQVHYALYTSDTRLSYRCITHCTLPTLSCHTGALRSVLFRHSVVIQMHYALDSSDTQLSRRCITLCTLPIVS